MRLNVINWEHVFRRIHDARFIYVLLITIFILVQIYGDFIVVLFALYRTFLSKLKSQLSVLCMV